jgi:hypothetical protein
VPVQGFAAETDARGSAQAGGRVISPAGTSSACSSAMLDISSSIPAYDSPSASLRLRYQRLTATAYLALSRSRSTRFALLCGVGQALGHVETDQDVGDRRDHDLPPRRELAQLLGDGVRDLYPGLHPLVVRRRGTLLLGFLLTSPRRAAVREGPAPAASSHRAGRPERRYPVGHLSP